MFNNIGRKIQTIGKVFAWIGIVANVLMGLGVILSGFIGFTYGIPVLVNIIVGILVMVFGTLLSLMFQYFVIGFGIVVEANEE